MINDYINLVDFKSFIFCNKLDLELINFNNYNSFIVLHVRAGILFLGVIIF